MMIKKRSIALFLAIVMIFTSLNFMMFTSNSANIITVDSATALSTLSGMISSATEPVTINFTANIDASGISFSSINTNKTLIVNGGNHYIKNLNLNSNGLFARVGSNSTIQNLGIVDAYVTNFSASNSATNKGIGLLCGYAMSQTSITGCFAHGSIAVYSNSDSTYQAVGGLVGYLENGTLNNSFTVVDIHTDASMVGGLIGRYTHSSKTANLVSISYSTGTIDNEGREYIGGLIGYSDTSCAHQCYTTVQIKNPYADTVKSIGVIPDLDSNVYYDENVCFQRQGDMDGAHRFTGVYNKFPEYIGDTRIWAYTDTYYPQINHFYSNSNKVFKNISAISAAIVHLDNSNDINLGYGREHMPLSTTSKYSTATITKDTAYSNNNKIDWKITGGVDEYYYDTSATAATPGKINGLSGNIFDSTNGKYIFTTEGDVVFTATSGGYERDITVHVSSGANPYIAGGSGTSSKPYLITNAHELDMVRLYCVDDLTGAYYYKVETPKHTVTGSSSSATVFTAIDLSEYTSWNPINGFKGNFNGTYNYSGTGIELMITNLNVDKAVEGNAGLFGNISGPATIENIFINNANINVSTEANVGILAGSANNATISTCYTIGIVNALGNAGGIIGDASAVTISESMSLGIYSATDNCGGFFGVADAATKLTTCYSSATVMDAQSCAGFIGTADGSTVKGSLSTCCFAPGIGGEKYGLSGGTVTVDNSYFDRQAASIEAIADVSGNEATLADKTTAELCTSSAKNDLGSNWSRSTSSSFSFLYPYLTKCETQLRYMAFNSVHYTSNTADEANANNFNKATLNSQYSQKIKSYDNYGNYTVANNNTITNVYGGREIFEMYKEGTRNTGTTYSYKRYVIFDVKDVNIYYRVATEGTANEYLNDMDSKALVDFISDSGVKYGICLTASDTYSSAPIKISDVEDSISIAATVPSSKYTYTVSAYSNSAETEVIDPLSANTFGIVPSASNGRYVIYIKISMTQKDPMPWGIFNIDCN